MRRWLLLWLTLLALEAAHSSSSNTQDMARIAVQADGETTSAQWATDDEGAFWKRLLLPGNDDDGEAVAQRAMLQHWLADYQKSNNGAPCVDMYNPEDCIPLSYHGNCVLDFAFMNSHCRLSCGFCLNVTAQFLYPPTHYLPTQPSTNRTQISLSLGELREKVLRRLRYIQLSQKSYPSSLPSFPYGVETTDPVILKTKEILRVMDVYAREWIPLPTSSLPCHNVRPECAYWAASSDACRTNTQYMMQECPLVCLACQYRHIFDTCHARASAYHASVSPLSTDQLQRIRRRLMERDQTTNVLASSSSKMDIWAYRIDRFLPDSDRNELLESLSKQWQPSSTYGFDVNGTTWPNHVMMDYTLSHDLRRASSSAYLLSCLNDDLASTKKYSSAACKTLYNLQSKMAQELGVPIEHIEKPIEFVRHREGQSFAKHHDYRYVDEWKAGGPRILTAYLQLSGSKDSNGDSITTEIGFPDVDWTIVPVETGQLLIWPNVASEGDATNAEPRVVPHPYMSSEVLAPKDGTVLGLYIHVRMYPVRPEVDDSSMPEDCH